MLDKLSSRDWYRYARWLLLVLAPFAALLIAVLVSPSIGKWVRDYETLVSAFVGLASVVVAVLATGKISAENEKRRSQEAQLAVAIRLWAETRRLLADIDMSSLLTAAERVNVDKVSAMRVLYDRLKLREDFDFLSLAQHPSEMSGYVTLSLVAIQSKVRMLMGERRHYEEEPAAWIDLVESHPDLLETEIGLYRDACVMVESLSVFLESEIEKLTSLLTLPSFENAFQTVRNSEPWQQTGNMFSLREEG